MTTTSTPQGIADDIVELLSLCQTLQSEKEGVIRPATEVYTRDDDPFADRIRQAIGFTRKLQLLSERYLRLKSFREFVR